MAFDPPFPSLAAWEASREKIRLRAYYLWEGWGRPEGISWVFWAMAEWQINWENTHAI